MMTRAYNQYYLEDAMQSLGAMLDYAVNTCGQELKTFYGCFLASGVGHEMACANPKYMGMSGVELAMLSAELTGIHLPYKDPLIDVGSPEYWTGWALAYISWYYGMDYTVLQSRGVSADVIYNAYTPFHEADLSNLVSYIDSILEKSNPLRMARTNAGLTQAQLARESGVPIRVIRSLEQGSRQIESAAAGTILHLSRALSCNLLPHPGKVEAVVDAAGE